MCIQAYMYAHMYASQKVAYISCIHEYFFSIEELKTRDLDRGSPNTISLDSGCWINVGFEDSGTGYFCFGIDLLGS